MASEYILFKKQELRELEKTFLMTQLNILSSLKNLREYKKARAEEFSLKVNIKSIAEGVENDLLLLNKLLPHTSFKLKNEESENEIIFPEAKIEPTKLTIEDELEKIKKRLALLG